LGTVKLLTEKEAPPLFGGRPVDRDMLRLVCGVTLAVVVLVVSLLRPPVEQLLPESKVRESVRYLHPNSAAALVDALQEAGLWDLDPSRRVVPLVVTSFPSDLSNLPVATRKKIFLHSLLPTVLVALAEVEQERQALERIGAKIGLDCQGVTLPGKDEEWLCRVDPEELFFLRHLAKKYRADTLEELLVRVDGLPVSLVLAQAAMESSWGTSRFAVEGNNLFGVWTWGDDGLIPLEREDGATHRVASYPTVLDSVRSYLLTINRHAAYDSLRRLRTRSFDSMVLVDGLLFYSERRHHYVEELRQLIKGNDLTRFDGFQLDTSVPEDLRLRLAGEQP